jgi:hypothetical protein
MIMIVQARTAVAELNPSMSIDSVSKPITAAMNMATERSRCPRRVSPSARNQNADIASQPPRSTAFCQHGWSTSMATNAAVAIGMANFVAIFWSERWASRSWSWCIPAAVRFRTGARGSAFVVSMRTDVIANAAVA